MIKFGVTGSVLSLLPQIKVSFNASLQISIEFVTFPAGAHDKPTCSTAGNSVVKFAKSLPFLHHLGVLLNRRKGKEKKDSVTESEHLPFTTAAMVPPSIHSIGVFIHKQTSFAFA